VKLLRTIRLDASDGLVFERAAAPGEWAVSGAFLFATATPETLTGKARVAFRSGLLGIDSLGWSTLAVVTEASAAERDEAVATLARHLRHRCGAPSDAEALAAAQEEIAFAATLCEHPPGTLVAVHRSLDGDGIRERFRTLTPRPGHGGTDFRAFDFFETSDAEEPDETVDLVTLGRKDSE
jgi:hypothetical protein